MRQKLRQIRLQKGVSQTHLAKKLGFKTASGYGNIEMGRNRLSLDQAAIIAGELNVTVNELLDDDVFFLKKLHVESKSTA